MFGKTITIIAINKEKIVGAKVKPGSSKIKKSIELGWEPETLDVVLSQVVKALKAKKVRVLLSNDLSYVVRLKVPFNLNESQKREFISEKLSQQIPEVLEEDDWDYKDIKFDLTLDEEKTETEHEVIVFSPVKHFFEELSKALEKLDLEVEAIEPEAIAKTRDANPIFGLAKKKDIKGKDEQVLNMEPLDIEPKKEEIDDEFFEDNLLTEEAKEMEKESKRVQTSTESSDESNVSIKPKKKRKMIKVVVVLILALGLIGIGVFAYFYFNKPEEVVESDVQKMEVAGEKTGNVETLGKDEQEVVAKKETSELSVQVQNGSGIIGEATYVGDILAAEGFENIETANADSYDYVETEVELKTFVDEQIFERIERALNSDYQIASRAGVLGSDSEYDVVVIIGTRIE